MWRLVWAQVVVDWRRSLATFSAVLFAVSSFVVLTGASTTQRLEVTATLEENWRSAFDILVRPPEARGEVEELTGRVRPAFLTETYGGITLEQLDAIRDIAGVEVAAPIGTVGMIWQTIQLELDLNDVVAPSGTQLFRVELTTYSRGQTFPARGAYVYVTDNPLTDGDTRPVHRWARGPHEDFMGPTEVINGVEVSPCIPVSSNDQAFGFRRITDPFDDGVWASFCISRTEVAASGFVVDIPIAIPLSIAAIDPLAEAQLFGLDTSIIAGRFFTAEDGLIEREMAINWWMNGTMPISPALLSTGIPNTDLQIKAAIVELGDDAITELLAVNPRDTTPFERVGELDPIFRANPDIWHEWLSDGTLVFPRRVDQMDIVAAANPIADFGIRELSLADAFARFNVDFANKVEVGKDAEAWAQVSDMRTLTQAYAESREIWTCILIRPSPVRFEGMPNPDSILLPPALLDDLANYPTDPEAVPPLIADPFILQGTVGDRMLRQPANCPGVAEAWASSPEDTQSWWFPVLGTAAAPAYRNLHALTVQGDAFTPLFGNIGFDVVGLFDPDLVDQGGDEFARVAMETYRTEPLLAADAATVEALGSELFLPNLNPIDYFTLPPSLLIPMDSVGVLDNRFLPREGWLGVDRGAPISAVRVRVAGVTGLDAASLEVIRLTAERIEVETGLAVDITVGSSLVDQPVTLAQPGDLPDLRLVERWSQVGAVTVIQDAVDQKSVLLFTLILASGVLTIAAVAAAGAAAQRKNLGTLAAIGYRPARLWGFLLGQQVTLGLLAGAVGALVSWPIAAVLGIHISVSRTLLAVPIAAVLTCLAALPSAVSVARTRPIVLLRPAVRAARRAFPVTSAVRLGVTSMLRRPLRLVRATVAIAIAIGAVTVLVVINTTFHGMVTGTLLGNSVLLQVRTADVVAGTILAVLGLVCLAMTMRFAHLEDASDWAILSAVGWPRRRVTTAILTQGALAGVGGAVLGLLVALVLTTQLIGTTVGAIILPAVLVALAAIPLTTLTALVPAAALNREPLTHTLTRE